MCEEITGNKMNCIYNEKNRVGDHLWYISDISKFRSHYPAWEYKYNLLDTLNQIFHHLKAQL